MNTHRFRGFQLKVLPLACLGLAAGLACGPVVGHGNNNNPTGDGTVNECEVGEIQCVGQTARICTSTNTWREEPCDSACVGEESAAYLSLNRSKRGLGLDLGKPEGRAVFFRPGGILRYGGRAVQARCDPADGTRL